MPIPISISPTSGSSNGTVSVSCPEYKGRLDRTQDVTVTCIDSGVNIPVGVCTVKQTGKPEYLQYAVTPPAGGITFAAQDSSTAIIEVKTNCRKVNCAVNSPASLVRTQYKVPGSNVYVGVAIQDIEDWGADDEYGIKFYIAAAGDNNSTKAKTSTIIISSVDNSNIALRINVTQAASAEAFAVSPLVVNFESDSSASSGYSDTISVSSNTTWTVEVSD